MTQYVVHVETGDANDIRLGQVPSRALKGLVFLGDDEENTRPIQSQATNQSVDLTGLPLARF